MDLADLSRRVALIDAALRPIATRPVPVEDLEGWVERMRAAPPPAEEASVDADPVLAEVAALSSDIDRYGMGSIRTIVLRCMNRRPEAGRQGGADI